MSPARACRPCAPSSVSPGARKMTGAPHTPVLLAEVIEALQPAPGLTVVDGTFGAGGYSRAFLAAGARVVAFDRDPAAAAFAAALEAGERLRLVAARPGRAP